MTTTATTAAGAEASAAVEPDQAEPGEAERPLALGYLRAHLLMTEAELSDAKADLADYAEREGYRLGSVFVERAETVPEGFRELIDGIGREEPRAVVTPNALHLAVLGLPPRVMQIIYSATGVPVLLANLPAWAQVQAS